MHSECAILSIAAFCTEVGMCVARRLYIGDLACPTLLRFLTIGCRRFVLFCGGVGGAGVPPPPR